jgi:uncharacterized delta-60 repeat protein
MIVSFALGLTVIIWAFTYHLLKNIGASEAEEQRVSAKASLDGGSVARIPTTKNDRLTGIEDTHSKVDDGVKLNAQSDMTKESQPTFGVVHGNVIINNGPAQNVISTQVGALAKAPDPARPTENKIIEPPVANVDRIRTPINSQVFQASAGPDEKIYIAGSFSAVGEEIHVGIARLNSNGSVDSTFTPEVESGGFAFSFFSDGSFLLNSRSLGILNFSRRGAPNRNFPSITAPRTLIQIADGSFYTSSGKYSPEGILSVRFTESMEAMAMALQPNGKIIIGASGGKLIRLNADGTLDITFTAPAGIRGGNVHGVGVQSDGKIVGAGGGFALLPNVFRLNRDGTLDRTFRSATDSYGPIHCLPDGTILISSGNNGTSITFDPSGRIVAAGSITRLAADGSLHSVQLTPDPNFGEVPGVCVYLPVR